MKLVLVLLLPLLLPVGVPIPVSTSACRTNNKTALDTTGPASNVNRTMSNRLRIRVGSRTFTATLSDTPTVTALTTRLPLTLPMTELNGNEKYGALAGELPTSPVHPGAIQAGDLMLYGYNTLVLFYKSFRTAYPYTKLGQLDDPTGLATALGAGNVTVTFERM